MDSYGQYCPVAKAHEILGDRWTMLIVRELVSGRETFNDIARGLPGIPRSLLTNRLQRLIRKGVLLKTKKSSNRFLYQLTDAGKDLKAVVDALGNWGAHWAFDIPEEADLDPGLLLWRMRHRLNIAALPPQRIVIQFDFQSGSSSLFWFIIEDAQASVCLTNPKFEIDLAISADLSVFYQVWLGRKSLLSAQSSRDILIEGSPSLERQFCKWFLWSPMASFVKNAVATSQPKISAS